MIVTYALIFAFACFGFGLLSTMWRMLMGPTQADRILALDTMVINFIALIVLYGIWQGEPPLRLSFLPDGSYVRAGPEGESRGGWRLVRTVGTGQRGPLGSFLRLTVDAFSAGRSEIVYAAGPEGGARMGALVC